MLDVRIREAVLDGFRKFFEFFLRKIQRRDNFFEEKSVEILREDRIVHEVEHDVVSREVSCQHRSGMAAVQDPDLAFLVGLHVICPDHVSSALVDRQNILPFRIAFDDPQIEQLAGIDQVVFVSELFAELRGLFSGIAGDDPVDEGACEFVIVFDPADEFGFKVPFVCVFQNDSLKLRSVVVDKLDRKEQQAFIRIAVKSLKAAVQELGDLSRE